jgi:hypothetical protein
VEFTVSHIFMGACVPDHDATFCVFENAAASVALGRGVRRVASLDVHKKMNESL